MDRRYEIQHLWELSITKKKGWQRENCPVVRGDYGDLENAWKNATKAMAEHQRDDLMKKIEAAIERQTEFRKQERAEGEFVPQPILISAFINKKRYNNEVILAGEEAEVIKESRICNHPGCGSEVHGPRYSKCSLHQSLFVLEAK